MSGLDAYRVQLVEAGARLGDPRAPRRRPWRQRRALVVALAAIAVGAPALAATHPWQPELGDRRFDEGPKAVASAPPKAQLDALGVLRRAQTERDRGAAAQNALHYFGASQQEIHTDYVRVLGSERDGTVAVLVPAKHWDPAGSAGPSPLAKDDPLCLFVPSGVDGGAKNCWTLGEITAGQATGSLGAHYYGLVPDGVARVRVIYADAKVITHEVVDNYYSFHQRGESRDISWLAADGTVLRTAGARAPSHSAPRRYRYHGRWITAAEAYRRKLGCEDSHRVCADSDMELQRLVLGKQHR